MDSAEHNRRWRRIDWMLTAHSVLRDRYARRSQALTLSVIFFSIIGLVFALANSEDNINVLGAQVKLQTFLALLAALTFLVGLVDLVVDWRRRAWQHADAARKLGFLKAAFAKPRDGQANERIDQLDLFGEYDRTMAELIVIPDGQAAALKARHVRKVEVFKRIEANPGAPRWWLNICVMRSGMKRNRGHQMPKNGP
jgi:hypothetical protein